MKYEEIVQSLCYYDERNPDGQADDTPRNYTVDSCFCDNCFSGKSELANELLKYVKPNKD